MTTAIAPPVAPAYTGERFMTLEEFDHFVVLPENRDHNFEWHNGRVIELVSNTKSSNAGFVLASFVQVQMAATT